MLTIGAAEVRGSREPTLPGDLLDTGPNGLNATQQTTGMLESDIPHMAHDSGVLGPKQTLQVLDRDVRRRSDGGTVQTGIA